MIKRVVISAPARGYVDGRFIGEEKEPRDGAGRGRRGKSNANADSILGSVTGAGRSGKGRGQGQGKARGAGAAADNIGNTTAKNNRGRSRGSGQGSGKSGGQGRGQPRAAGTGTGEAGLGNSANGQPPRGRGRRPTGSGQSQGAATQGHGQGQGHGQAQGQRQDGRQGKRRGSGTGQPRGEGYVPGQNLLGGVAPAGQQARKSRGSKKTPFRSSSRAPQSQYNQQQMMSPTQSADIRRSGDESKSGQFAEALAASANVKRERLHKVLAQSGHGSRRDMEILISSGRLMVNGIVATAGTQVASGDNVLLDLRPIKLKFSEDLPRVLLYHKPEGEIVTTNDPGNRITVFDNLPRVENGKWVSVGRLDINTSGLLIFTTSGELANRFMHPRYEVEREYAVRILGELTEEQGKRLLDGIVIDRDDAKASDRDDHLEEFEHEDHLAHLGHDDHGMQDVHDEHDELDADGTHNIAPAMAEAAPVTIADKAHDEDLDDDIFNRAVVAAPVAKPVIVKTTVPATPLRDGLARFDSIEKRGGEGVNQWYHVVIKEGRNREVRKMFEALGLTVSRLIRIRFGKIELPPRLARGKMMELEPSQVKSVLVSAGMPVEGGTAPLPAGMKSGPRPERNNGERGNNKRGQRDGRNAGSRQPGEAGSATQVGEGQAQRGPRQAPGARAPRGERRPNVPREPRAPREGRVPRDSNAEFLNNADITPPLDENGLPIAMPQNNPEGNASRNKRRSRGGRGARGGRDRRDGREGRDRRDDNQRQSAGPGDNTSSGGDGSFASSLARDVGGNNNSGADTAENIGNTSIGHAADGQARAPRAPRALRDPNSPNNAGAGRGRRNLRGRKPGTPRDVRSENAGDNGNATNTGNAAVNEGVAFAKPPKDNLGNE